MVIEINGKQYIDPDWRVENGIAEIRIHSEKTFAEIADDFVLDAGDSIIQYNDNDEQVGEWYVEGMASIQLPGEDGSDVVTIKYHISQLAKDAQEALNEDLDDTTMSVLELAGLLSTAKKNFQDTANRLEGSLSEQEQRISNISQTQTAINQSIARIDGLYNALADRVARLENK